jgi:CheY-like chemotaxis protein
MKPHNNIRHIEKQKLWNATDKAKIPIVAAAHAIEGYREKCLESRMDYYIAKPLKKDELIRIVGKWISPNLTPKK